MNKTEICRKTGNLGKNNKRTVIYYLLEDDADENFPKEFGAGIEIAENNEASYVRRITPSRENAMRLVDILASNFVTPVSLGDVVEDWMEM